MIFEFSIRETAADKESILAALYRAQDAGYELAEATGLTTGDVMLFFKRPRIVHVTDHSRMKRAAKQPAL